MWPNPQFSADLETFIEEILHGKHHFCAVFYHPIYLKNMLFFTQRTEIKKSIEIIPKLLQHYRGQENESQKITLTQFFLPCSVAFFEIFWSTRKKFQIRNGFRFLVNCSFFMGLMGLLWFGCLTNQMPLLPSCNNQSVDLKSKSIDCFLYEGNTGI